MTEHADLVDASLREESATRFDERVERQATRLIEEHRTGRLDSPTFGIGLELEAYAVDGSGRLTRVPDPVFEGPCDKELGVHNVEFQTDPAVVDADGIASQATQLRESYRDASAAASESGVTLVLDAMWAVPPASGTKEYLSVTESVDGIETPTNMTPSSRYYAIDRAVLREAGGAVSLSVPGVDLEFPSILVESLTSSIQPHLQVPEADAYPRYHNLANRTLGPVLALATNSPLLPVDLYDVDDPYALLEDTYHELRIPVFEQSINDAWEKVRFPADVDDVESVLDDLVADHTCAPFLREWLADDERDSFADQYWELDHKRGTYWRWVRAVIGGRPVGGGDERSIRVEYRPLPAQPTVRDNVGFQCLVAGLLRGLVVTDHPLEALDLSRARECFYDVVESGLEADIAWITSDGEQTADPETIYPELFGLARRGLEACDVPADVIDTYLSPVEARWNQRTTPSRWKLRRVRAALDDGADLEAAVREMHSEYVRRAGDGEPFSAWTKDE